MTRSRRALTVVSPQFPCGAAWLANALIELGVMPVELWGFDTTLEWVEDPEGNHLYVAEHWPWRQTLASLKPGARFRFDSAIAATFTHLFPWQIQPAADVIVVLRDPRDALYSEWRRQRRNGQLDASINFAAFAGRPFHGGPLSNADLLWLHLRCWFEVHAAGQIRVHLVRFEDWKRNDCGVLASVVAWLGLVRTAPAIARACAASEVGLLLAVEEEVVREDPTASRFNHRGRAQEWLTSWSADEHRALGPHWQSLLADLGYRRSPLVGGRAPRFDTREVLCWRDPIAAADLAAWASRVDVWKMGRP